MEDCKLSIIIPAFNVESYLERCILSCETQDIPKETYEVIIIDDGSSDSTLQVARRLETQYSNLRVYSQNNQGQSVARNLGIDKALGEYVWFVDSDDYIESNCLSKIIGLLEIHQLEILSFLMNVFSKDGSFSVSQPERFEFNRVYDGEYLVLNGVLEGSVCSRIFKRTFIKSKDLSFFPHIIHQDSEFTIRAFSLVRRMMFISEAYYYYYYNAESSTRCQSYEKVKKAHLSDAQVAYNIQLFAQTHEEFSDQLRQCLIQKSRSILVGRFISYLTLKSEFKRQIINDFIATCKSLGVYPLSKNKLNLKNTLIISIINIEKLYRWIVNLK